MLSGVSLPNSWSSMPSAGAGPEAWMQAYAQMGQASTAANQQLGNVFVAGSNQNLAQQQAALSNAMGYLKGTNRANIRSINRRFSAESGDMEQELIGRGLGNATIQGSMETGLTRAHSDAISGARAAFGNTMFQAAYQAAIANSGLAQQQLNTQFQGTNIGYPDMGAFAHMAGMGMSGGGGNPFGGGGLTMMPQRPTGGERPAWTYYGGGGSGDIGADMGGSGLGGWATGYGGNQVAMQQPQAAPSGMRDLYAGGNYGGMGEVA